MTIRPTFFPYLSAEPRQMRWGQHRIVRVIHAWFQHLIQVLRLDALIAPRRRARRADRMAVRLARAAADVDRFATLRSEAQVRLTDIRRTKAQSESLLRREQAALSDLLNQIAGLDTRLRNLHHAMILRRDDPRIWSAGEGATRYALRNQIARLDIVQKDVRRLHVDLSAELIEFD